MIKTTALFIRACKSGQPHKRLLSVYRRYYLRSNSIERDVTHISHILMGIVQDNNLASISQIMHEFSEDRDWMYRDLTIKQRTYEILIGVIRMSDVRRFPSDFPIPRRFRA